MLIVIGGGETKGIKVQGVEKWKIYVYSIMYYFKFL